MRYRGKQKKEKSFADNIVYISIIAVVVFTIAAFVLQFKGLMEISPTVTTCWFAFWTVEIVALAAIKTSKVKHDYNKEEDDTSDDEEDWEVYEDDISD